mmetsp:Transcript_45854/g.130928  ORF Transcript_45854/g.130928 Transcript_45854/m.130928 type:complete len:263 (+) Transcript_45854:89-877(+)
MSALIAEIGGEVSPERNGLTVPDVAVTVEGEKVMAFSTVLALSSPVFAALLGSVMREGRTKEVNLPGKSKGEFELFLSFLQPCSRVRVSPDNVDVMLPWFDEYQVQVFKDECEDVLLGMPCTARSILQAKTFGLEKQYKRCLKDLNTVEFKDHFAELAQQPQVLRDILPRMETAIPGLNLVSTAICETLDTPRLQAALPFFEACIKQSGGLDDNIASLVRTLVKEALDESASTTAAAELLAMLLQAREEVKSKRWRSTTAHK